MARVPVAVVIGVDVGTSGVRTVAATSAGTVLAQAQEVLPSRRSAHDALHEQEPEDWWKAVCQTVGNIAKTLKASEYRRRIRGVAFTSTSGSLVVTDSGGVPVRPAILYDDPRGREIAAELNHGVDPGASPFNSSFSLVKALWVWKTEPRTWQRIKRLMHPADWLAGKLTGQFGVSDYSHAMKLGFDVETWKWNEALSVSGLPSELLPTVVRPGQKIGEVSQEAAEETGLPVGTAVVAGATDGMASLIASGAKAPGDGSTTLGTTFVWKVLTRIKPCLASGMYCHYHPANLWAPGAASNTGPGSLLADDPTVEPREWDRWAAAHLPTPIVCYTLRARGERFPFDNSVAKTFWEGEPRDSVDRYAAQLQSLAFVERWGYERLQACGVEVGPTVFSTGAAAASRVLAQLRSNVLHRIVIRCRYPTSAFGAAVLAAAETFYSGDLGAAIEGMTHVSETASPDPAAALRFAEVYKGFREACARRGYA